MTATTYHNIPARPLRRADRLEQFVNKAIVACFILTSIVATVQAVTYGWQQSTGPSSAISKPMLGIVVIMGEALGAVLIARFLRAEAWGWAAGAAVFWLAAFSYSLFLTVSAAAGLNDSVANRRTGQSNTYAVGQSEVRRLQAKVDADSKLVDAARGRLAGVAPMIDGRAVTTIAEAEAAVKVYTADPLFRSTDGCVTIKGKQSRALCTKLTEASSAIAALKARGSVADDVKAAETTLAASEVALAAALKTAGSTETVASGDLPIVTFLIGLFPFLSKETLNIIFAAHAGIVVQVFLTLSGLFVEEAQRSVDDAEDRSTEEHIAQAENIVQMTPMIVERRIERSAPPARDPFGEVLAAIKSSQAGQRATA